MTSAGVRAKELLPVGLLLAFYMLTFSRWGSYLRPPGSPVYIGDITLAVASIYVGTRLARRPVERRNLISRIQWAPLGYQVLLVLSLYALVRLLIGGNFTLAALRDAAPYAYGLLALLALQEPTREGTWGKRLVFGAFTTHLAWAWLLPMAPGFPWQLPTLGADAVLLVTRPDFDATVMGIAAAVGLKELLGNQYSIAMRIGLSVFTVANLIGASSLLSRAGFLATILGLGFVLLPWALAFARRPTRLGTTGRVGSLALAVGAGLLLLALTPSGQRLVAGLLDNSSESRGTISARSGVWENVVDFTTREPVRTAAGVGFGANIVQQSGASLALEGSTYQDVRSPHNFLLSAFAHLGVAGFLLALVMLSGGIAVAVRMATWYVGPVTMTAILVLLTFPVIAMLGVILESPFGALPYFWAWARVTATWQSHMHAAVR